MLAALRCERARSTRSADHLAIAAQILMRSARTLPGGVTQPTLRGRSGVSWGFCGALVFLLLGFAVWQGHGAGGPTTASPTAEQASAGANSAAPAVPVVDASRVEMSPRQEVRSAALHGDPDLEHTALDGIVLVDGHPAKAGLRLALRIPRAAVGVDVEDPLRARSPRAGREWLVETRASGWFSFAGLPAGWSGELVLPDSHWLLPADPNGPWGQQPWHRNVLSIAAPAPRLLEVRTTALPIVRGQVRVASDGAPMAGAELGIRVELAGGVSCGASCISDAAGSFQAVLVPDVDALHRQWCEPERRPAFAHGTVVCVRGPGMGGPVTVELSARHLAGEPVLVAVELAPRVHFRATSQDGSPVVGARVNVARSEPGDLDGRGWYQGATNELLVGAVDSCVVPAVAHGGLGSEQHPVQFTLPARNTLRIAVVDRQGQAAEVASVQLHASGPIFVGGRSQTAFDEQFGASAFAMQMAGRRRSTDGTTNPYWRGECKPGANAVIVLHSLEPGVRIDAVARDAFGMELASAAVQAPSFGEARDLTLVVDADLRSIRGRVLASSGGPVVGARVAVEADGRRLELVVGEDGSFRSAPFRISAPVQVRAVAEGFAPASTWIDARSAADSAVELRLEIGHSVTVTVVGDRGEPVAVYAYPVGFEREQAQVLSLGVFQWASLPSRVVFRAELSGRHFEIEHDARQPTVQLRVPTPAQVLAPLAGLPPGAGVGATDSLVVLRLLDDEAARPVRLAWAQAEQAPTSVLPGRYRATVVRRGGAEGSEIETGIGREFVLPAGVLTQLDFGK